MGKKINLSREEVEKKVKKASTIAIDKLYSGELTQSIEAFCVAPKYQRDITDIKYWKLEKADKPIWWLPVIKQEITIKDPKAEYSAKGAIVLTMEELSNLLSSAYQEGVKVALDSCEKSNIIAAKAKLLNKPDRIVEEKKKFLVIESDSRNERLIIAEENWSSTFERAKSFIKRNEFLRVIFNSFGGIFSELKKQFIKYIVDEVINKPVKKYIAGVANSFINSFFTSIGELFGVSIPAFEMAV